MKRGRTCNHNKRIIPNFCDTAPADLSWRGPEYGSSVQPTEIPYALWMTIPILRTNPLPPMKRLHLLLISLFILTGCSQTRLVAQTPETVQGTVYHDQNRNGTLDSGEPGVANVLVSNGIEIDRTDADGTYELPLRDQSVLFVIKPRDWMTPVDELNIPRFYHIASREDASGSDYPGLEATGLPDGPVHFPLVPHAEPDSYRALVFGDTQPRTIDEIHYLKNDSVQELIGVQAAFGVTLGDLVFDDLNLFDPLNETIAQIGLPWRHIIGNHDIDYSAESDWDARGAYLRTYGPSWYAWSWGPAHFVALDNVRIVDGENGPTYRTGLGEDQYRFLQAFLDEIPDNERVFLMMHIPWVDSTPWISDEERTRVFDLLASHPTAVTFAAHTHRHFHRMIDESDGWPGSQPHHMVSMGTSCGAWWTGAPDEFGIPHSTMRDGTPTGYGFLNIDGQEWSLTYKAARREAGHQMHLSLPDVVDLSQPEETVLYANIYNALPDAHVEYRVDHGPWQPMVRFTGIDPTYQAMRDRELEVENPSWRVAGPAQETPHLWRATLPNVMNEGVRTIEVRSRDRWNRYEGQRLIQVVRR